MLSIAQKEKNHNKNIENENYGIKHWTDLWFTDGKKSGFVAITDFKKQFFYGLNDKTKLIASTKGKEKQFISINAFDVDFNSRDFSRETSRLKQIRNIAIDIDQYKLGLSIEDGLREIRELVRKRMIPEPNLVLTSRGIQIFYSIHNGASPKLAWVVGQITEQFILKLVHIGADLQAKDMSRVMRVPNSINERNRAIVEPFIWNDMAYSIQELQSYCKPLNDFNYRGTKKRKVFQLNYDSSLSFFYKTNYARLTDLRKLIELRKGDFTGKRNIFLYMYAYHQSLVLSTQKDVLYSVWNEFQHIYSRTDKPMTKREFEKTVKSAYRDAEEFFNRFKEDGYKVIYRLNDGIKKPYKTDKFIKLLDISIGEQMQMRSLRNKEVRKGQKAEYMRKKRRENGIGSMETYNEKRREQKEELLQRVIELKKQGKKQKEIADLLGISKGRVSQLIKKFNDV